MSGEKVYSRSKATVVKRYKEQSSVMSRAGPVWGLELSLDPTFLALLENRGKLYDCELHHGPDFYSAAWTICQLTPATHLSSFS